MNLLKNKSGFTLIELLIVISIIGLLSSVVLTSLNSAKAKARDATRLSMIDQLQNALEMYYYDHNFTYPNPYNADDNYGGWDIGNQSHPLFADGRMTEYIPLLRDPSASGDGAGLRYYRYQAGSGGCPADRGAFYVIEINMETTNFPRNPGWSCSGRNWTAEGSYVIGNYEN